jgi:hypothetical protein
MSSHNSDPDTLLDEANRLYWESEESVNQIGEALGLSKGVLYGLISPLPAGLPCPACGEEMVFPNRTAREKGFLACPACGMEEEEAAVQTYWEGEAQTDEGPVFEAPRALAHRAGQAVQQAVDSGRERVSNLTPRGRIIAGTALLGAAAGLALGAYLRKK